MYQVVSRIPESRFIKFYQEYLNQDVSSFIKNNPNQDVSSFIKNNPNQDVSSCIKNSPNQDVRRTVFLKHRSNWNSVRSAVRSITWSTILKSADSLVTFDRAISEVIGRYVPTTVLCS